METDNGDNGMSEGDTNTTHQKYATQEMIQQKGTVEADAGERIEFRDPPQQSDSEEHEGPVA